MVISWRTYRARTGVVETELAFGCARCGAHCPMRIRTQGFGSSDALYGVVGGSADAAQSCAVADATARAKNAARFVRCPGCGGVSRELEAQYEAVFERIARRAERAVPVAVVLGVVAAVVLGGVGLRDIDASSAALVAGIAAGVTLFGASLFLLAQTEPVMTPPQAEVWLQWGGWLRGRLAVPPDGPSTDRERTLGAIMTVVGGMVTLFALGAWSSTFGDVYIADSEARATLDVTLDGAPVAARRVTGANDAQVFELGVRTSRPHTLVVAGEERPFDLGGSPTSWLVVVGRKAGSVCVFEREVIYGAGNAKPTRPSALWMGGAGVAELPRRYEHLFEVPPATVMAPNGQPVRRWVLRATSCPDGRGRRDAPTVKGVSRG